MKETPLTVKVRVEPEAETLLVVILLLLETLLALPLMAATRELYDDVKETELRGAAITKISVFGLLNPIAVGLTEKNQSSNLVTNDGACP